MHTSLDSPTVIWPPVLPGVSPWPLSCLTLAWKTELRRLLRRRGTARGLDSRAATTSAALWFPAAGSERGSDGCLVLECTVSEWLWLDTSCLGRKPPW